MGRKLLTDQELAKSAVVANNRMNRQRKATGINSYENDLKFNPIDFLEQRSAQATVRWIDLACGEGNALIETSNFFKTKNKGQSIELMGIDLVDYFSSREKYSELLSIKVTNLSEWIPQQQFDLITIVHGLHYLGDKIGLMQKAAMALKFDGVFVGNLDLNNIEIIGCKDSQKLLKNYFKKEKIQYNSRTKILKIINKTELNNSFRYIGASDKAGPNYTGQEGVNSFYQLVS